MKTSRLPPSRNPDPEKAQRLRRSFAAALLTYAAAAASAAWLFESLPQKAEAGQKTLAMSTAQFSASPAMGAAGGQKNEEKAQGEPPQPQAVPQPAAEPEPETAAQPEAEPEPVQQSDNEPAPKAEPEQKPEPKPEVKPEPRSQLAVEPKKLEKHTEKPKTAHRKAHPKPMAQKQKSGARTEARAPRQTEAAAPQSAAGASAAKEGVEPGTIPGTPGAASTAASASQAETLVYGESNDAFLEAVLAAVRSSLNYPRRARAHGWEGEALTEFSVAADGTLTDFRIVRSSGRTLLDKAAEKAIVKAQHRWGQPSRSVRIRLPVRFSLSS
jgi:protein TonB